MGAAMRISRWWWLRNLPSPPLLFQFFYQTLCSSCSLECPAVFRFCSVCFTFSLCVCVCDIIFSAFLASLSLWYNITKKLCMSHLFGYPGTQGIWLWLWGCECLVFCFATLGGDVVRVWLSEWTHSWCNYNNFVLHKGHFWYAGGSETDTLLHRLTRVQ